MLIESEIALSNAHLVVSEAYQIRWRIPPPPGKWVQAEIVLKMYLGKYSFEFPLGRLILVPDECDTTGNYIR